MKQFIFFIAMLFLTQIACAQTKRDTLSATQISSLQANNIKLAGNELIICHKTFQIGFLMSLFGTAAALYGMNNNNGLGTAALVTGSISGIVGWGLVIDSHKHIKRAGKALIY